MTSLADMLSSVISVPAPPKPEPVTTLLGSLLEIVPAHPNSNLAKQVGATGVQRTHELERILKLPRRKPEDLVDLTDRYLINTGCPGCDLCVRGAPRLRPVQSRILLEAEQMGGAFCGVGVGAGKTLSALLLPTALGGGRTVLLVKPSLKAQMIDDAARYGRHFKIPTDKIWIVTYQELSTATTDKILYEIQPQAVVADEVHLLSRMSARSSRFWRFFKDYPATYFVGLTGSMMRRSMLDYAKFMALALGKNSPVPTYPGLKDWANSLDEPRDDAPKMPPGALELLCEPGETVPSGYRRRLRESPGVIITSGDEGVDASLEIRALPMPQPLVITKALTELEKFWAWDGVELDEAMSKVRVERQLVLGFFYRWIWPEGIRDEEWLSARNAWNREIRGILQHGSREGMDSALLLTNAVRRGEWKSETWAAWEPLMDRYKPDPPKEAIWLPGGESVAQLCADWARESPGVVWCWHEGFAEKVFELVPEVVRFGAGQSNELLAYAQSPLAGKTSLILSADAYAEGQNLQAWNRALVTSAPSAALKWQQILGRLHRPGQDSDTVTVDVLWNGVHEGAWHSAVANARSAEETLGQAQKLIYADLVGIKRD